MSRRLIGQSQDSGGAPVIGYAPDRTEGGHGSVGAYAPRNWSEDVVRVLVAAHGWAFEGQISNATGGENGPHFLRAYIEGQIGKRYPHMPFHVVTMDHSVPEIRPGSSGYDEYQPSAYDGHYVEDNKGKFDMVFLPDLGGDWETDESLELELETAKIFSILEGSLRLVKNGGWLYFSKIWEPHRTAGIMLGATLQDSVHSVPVPDGSPSDFMAIHKIQT